MNVFTILLSVVLHSKHTSVNFTLKVKNMTFFCVKCVEKSELPLRYALTFPFPFKRLRT